MSVDSCYLIAHDDFSRRLSQKFPNPPLQVRLLLERNFELTLDELDAISHGDDIDTAMFMFSLMFFRLKKEYPIGVRAIKYIDYFSYMYRQDFPFKESMFSFFSSTLSSEMLKCNNINELKQFILKLQEIKAHGIDISYFNSAIHNVYIKTMWDRITDISQPTDASKFIDFIENLKLGKSIGLDIDTFISTMLGSTIRYIEDRNDIHGLKRISGEAYETEVNTAKFLLNYILTLNIPEGTLMNKIRDILQVIGPIENSAPSSDEVDFNKLEFGNSIYVNSKNAKFHIDIHNASLPTYPSHPSYPSPLKVAVKIYKANNDIRDLESVKSEIQILKTLSAKASPNNYFLKYYGEYYSNNCLCLVMEHADCDLMAKITE